MKTYMGLENYDEIQSAQIAALNVDGFIVGDPFCPYRMFRYGNAGMIDFVHSVCQKGKEIIYQTPVYITDRNLREIQNMIEYLHDQYNVKKFLVQDVGLIDWMAKRFFNIDIIWGHWGRNRNSLMNHDFIEFLLKLGVSGIETGKLERIREIPKAGLPVYALYGNIVYSTISRDCYNSYMLNQFDGNCERECLSGEMSLCCNSFQMTVDGYILGRKFQYSRDKDFIKKAKQNSAYFMIYAADYQVAAELIKDVHGDNKNRKCIAGFVNRHFGKILVPIIVLAISLCILLSFKCFGGLAQTDLVSVFLTAAIALATGGFTLYQFVYLKRKGKIRIYNLYNSITSSLLDHVKGIGELVDKSGDMHYIAIAVKNRKVNLDKKVEMINELESLLYEHGLGGNQDNYFVRTIEITNEMHELIFSINTICDTLEEGSDITEENLTVIKQTLDYNKKLKVKFDEYYENIIKKYIFI